MWLCLLLAALLGALIGWWLAKSSIQRKLDDLNAGWQRKLEQQQSEHSQQLNQASQSKVAAAPPPAFAVAEPVVDDAALPADQSIDQGIDQNLDQSSYDVEEVEGIGPNYGKKLRDMGIHTTEQLLNKAFNMDGQIQIAEHIGIEDFVIRKWASMCDLMRLSGVEGQLSELMVYAGIDSVQDLAQQNSSTLHNTLKASNDEQNRVENLLDETSLSLVIDQAKSLTAILQDD